MLKKRSLLLMVIIVCIALLVACTAEPSPDQQSASTTEPQVSSEQPSASAEVSNSTEPEANFVKAADIVPPAGKRLAVLPVDQVAEETIKIAVIGIVSNPFDQAVYDGHEFAMNILKDRNVQCDYVTSPGLLDVVQLETTYRNCMSAGYDAIVCKGFNEQMGPVIAEAAEAGISTFLLNTQAGENGQEVSFWGQYGFDAAAKLAEEAVKLTGGEGKYAIITGSFNYSGHEDRRKGFRSVMDKQPGMELVGEYENNDLGEKAYEVATNIITGNPDIKLIYVTAGGPYGAAKAVKDANLSGKVIVVCHDWMDETVPYIRDGTIAACLDQEPFTQGYAPVIDAFNYLVGGVTPNKVNNIDGQIATPENVSELIPE